MLSLIVLVFAYERGREMEIQRVKERKKERETKEENLVNEMFTCTHTKKMWTQTWTCRGPRNSHDCIFSPEWSWKP